jgi:hypothetical protein
MSKENSRERHFLYAGWALMVALAAIVPTIAFIVSLRSPQIRSVERRALKCALHVHTRASDGLMADGEIIAGYAIAGYDVVAITDHDRVYAGREGVRNVCGRQVLVIAGAEESQRVPGTFKPCHVVTIHGVSILAHPKLNGLTANEFQAVNADYYEEWNTTCAYPKPGMPSVAWSGGYRGLGKIPIAVDDAHNIEPIGFAATAIDADMTVESVVEALREGRARVWQPVRQAQGPDTSGGADN